MLALARRSGIVGSRVCLIPRVNNTFTRGYKKQAKDGTSSGEEGADRGSSDADPAFQLLDVKIAYSEFMKYWKLPQKPVYLKPTPEDIEHNKRHAKIVQEEEAAYRKLFTIKQLQSWEAIFELPPHLFREAIVIDHVVIPTYQPWTDTPPDPNIKNATPPELPV